MVCTFNLNALAENGGQLGKLFVCLFRPFTTEQVNDIIMMSSCICISLTLRLNPKELLNHAYLCGVSIPVYKKVVCVCVRACVRVCVYMCALCLHLSTSLQRCVRIVHLIAVGGDYGY